MAKIGQKKAAAKTRARTTCSAGRARMVRTSVERDETRAADFMEPPGKTGATDRRVRATSKLRSTISGHESSTDRDYPRAIAALAVQEAVRRSTIPVMATMPPE